jgi:hypothetical protein
MFSVITNIYNKKTKGPTVMELFTATGKLIFFFLQIEMFDLCTIGYPAHIHTILKFFKNYSSVARTIQVLQKLEYRIDVCRITCGAHIEHL